MYQSQLEIYPHSLLGKQRTGFLWNLRLYEEISFIDSDTCDYDPRWQIGLTHTDVFDWQCASITAATYNVAVEGIDG